MTKFPKDYIFVLQLRKTSREQSIARKYNKSLVATYDSGCLDRNYIFKTLKSNLNSKCYKIRISPLPAIFQMFQNFHVACLTLFKIKIFCDIAKLCVQVSTKSNSFLQNLPKGWVILQKRIN